MPLEQIAVSSDSAAEAVARQLVQLATQTAQRIASVRKNGIPATDAVPPRQMLNGQVFSGRPASPAISAADIDAKLGPQNIAIFDAAASTFLPPLPKPDSTQ